MKKNIVDDHRLMLRVADLYYREKLTQAAISKRINISRPSVTKLLQNARRAGIVQISVVDPDGREFFHQEQQLEEKYDLKEVVIVETQKEAGQTRRLIGEAAGEYLTRILRDGDTVGVSMGTSVAAVGAYKPKTHFSGISFVPLVGGIGAMENNLHCNIIAENLAEHFGGNYMAIHAPAVVSRINTKIELMKEHSIQAVFNKAREMRIAIVGIGVPDPQSTTITTGYFTKDILEEIRGQDICGDVCMNFFDSNGSADTCPYNEKVVGIDIKSLRTVPYSIGVSFGVNKAGAIRGAIRGKYINVLVTDRETAELLLQMD